MRASGTRWRNWSGSETCRPERVYEPTTEDEIREILAGHGGEATVRVAGSGHSFPPVVPTDDVLVSLSNYTGLTAVDRAAGRVTVRAGTTLAELNEALADHGLALSNMGDVDRQTVAGALATGTHGTGIDEGVLATQAVRFRLVTADGDVRTLSPDDGDAFRAARVSLGALGVVSEVTLAVEPAYRLRERTWTAPLERVLADLERLRSAHRHVEFFWFPHTDTAFVKALDRTDAPVSGMRGAALGERAENVAWGTLCRLSARFPRATPTLARVAAATLSGGERVGPSHRIFPTRRDVRFEELEYGVPVEAGAEAVRAVREVVDDVGGDVIFPVEFRYVAGDDSPLSPAYGRDSAFVAVHTYHRKPYRSYLGACEERLLALEGRPHWGKRHTLGANALRERYPEWDAFREVRRSFDPEGVFLNDHLAAVLGERSWTTA